MTSSLRFFACATLAFLSCAGAGFSQESASGGSEVAKTSRFRIVIEEPEVTSSEDVKRLEQKLDQLIEKQGGAPAPTAPVAAAEKTPAAAPAATPAAGVPAEELTALNDAIKLVQDNSSYVWAMIAAVLVFNMQAGFAMLEIGFCRAKNCINVLMKSYLDFCVVSIVYLFVGFSFHFGDSWKGIIGLSDFWLSDFGADHKIWVFWFFQVGFAAVACTIASGAIAERTKYLGYLVYATVFMVIVYPLTGHWAWGGAGASWGIGGGKGWLEAMGFIDFAGSSVVHCCGGAAALAGIMVVGPRTGKFGKDGAVRLIAGHNIPIAALGALLLWFGWFGFNAGSTLIANSNIGRIAVNTLIAPSSGALLAMVSMWFIQGRPDVGIAINGSLGGAVGITASCANVSPASALIIGAVAGILTTVATIGLERARLDDVCGAVPVHLANGIWGTLCVALFDEHKFDISRLGVQALGTVSISLTSFVLCYITFKIISVTVGLRATDAEQEDGLDFSQHAANAYPDFNTSEQL